MSSHSIPGLSTTELHKLLNLTRNLKPAISQMPRLLQPFLDITRQKWVRNFIFTPHDIHIDYLRCPTLSSSALTCFMKATSIDAQAPAPVRSSLPGESHFISAHVLFAPVFTCGCLTLGVGAMSADVAMAVPWIRETARDHKMQLNMRFVRDGESQTLLIVYDAPKDGCFLVYTTTLESSTKGRRFTGFFLREPLRQVALGEEGKLKFTDIKGALILAQEEVHYRDCHVCGSAPALCSGCDMTIPKPLHPLDHSYFRKGLARHTSCTRSVACKTMFEKGIVKKQLVLGSRQEMGGIYDVKVTESLRDWSVSEFMMRTRADPMESVFMLGPAAGSAAITHETGHCRNANSEQDCQLIDMTGVEESPESSPETCLLPMFSVISPRSDRDNRASQPFVMSEFPSENRTTLFNEQVFATPSAESYGGNLGVQGMWWDGKGQNVCSENTAGMVNTGVVGNLTGLGHQDSASLNESQNFVLGLGGDQDEFKTSELAKMLKAERRKERNRQSARRSNLRNKKRREELKGLLEEELGRIEELRKREFELRRESLILKRQVREQQGLER